MCLKKKLKFYVWHCLIKFANAFLIRLNYVIHTKRMPFIVRKLITREKSRPSKTLTEDHFSKQHYHSICGPFESFAVNWPFPERPENSHFSISSKLYWKIYLMGEEEVLEIHFHDPTISTYFVGNLAPINANTFTDLYWGKTTDIINLWYV